MIEWAQRMGFGAKTGIPLRGEVEGRVPSDEYMKTTQGRRLLNGDVANMSIGQGVTEVTPLQMAQAVGIVANGGTFYQTRLVQQVQTLENEIITAFQVREKRSINASPTTIAQLHEAMKGVVTSRTGTAHAANIGTVEVAGKTGTAQWGPKNKERTAAWFVGFMPATQPQFAFAALYEGAAGADVHGGTQAAPLIASVFKEVYKGQAKNTSKRSRPADQVLAEPEEQLEDRSN
jgi:penicillin-binding protein 2